MNDLTRRPEMTAWHGLTPGLWTTLTNAQASSVEAVEAIRSDPQAVEMIRAALPELQARCRPCGEKAVVATLAPLLTVYGVGEKSQDQWKVFWGVYAELLGDMPLEGLQAGVKAYVGAHDSQFFPKPGPLKALCQAAHIPAIMALGRARKVLA